MGRAAVLNASLLLGMHALAQVGWEALLGAPTAPRPPHASVCLSCPVLAGRIGEGLWAVLGPAQALTQGTDGKKQSPVLLVIFLPTALLLLCLMECVFHCACHPSFRKL